MKIAVIGASGKTGRIFVDAALSAGHEIVAGIHQHNVLGERPGLTTKSCDTSYPNQIVELITGCDAVVSLIGHNRKSPAWLQTEAMTNIVSAMKTAGIKRLISLTGDGVRMPEDKTGLIDRMGNAMIKLVDPKRIADGIEHAKVLTASELDYTIVRVFKLTNGGLQPYTLTSNGPAKLMVARRTVAAAIIKLLADDLFLRQAPILADA